MPNIFLKIPKGSFAGDARTALVRGINLAVSAAEGIPDAPEMRGLCWVVIDEVEQGSWTLGTYDVTTQMLPCIAMIYVPAGVLDTPLRALYARLIHEAFQQAMPAHERRRLFTSVVLHDVADGTWSANGTIWTLPVFAKAAGFEHLQHLVSVG